MIQINANLFARVAVAQSSDPGRYYLNGVCIQPHPRGEGVTLTATDGHCLLTAHDPKADPTTLPAAGVIVNLGKDGLKAARKGRTVTIDPATGDASVDNAWRSASTTIVDGAFPDWRRILPQGDQIATGAAFDVKILSRLGDALCDWRKSSHGLTMRGADDASPHIIACDSPDAAIFAVCMPIRVTPATTVPTWL
jgi:DNA polymerase III sliding clamp (beta) subunit (PCNA family)